MDPQKRIADALSCRLSMQISLSSLPIVEEWMDARLTRWLESIPLPMEMGSEDVAIFDVAVASTLQQLSWGAFGTPRAFIPKLAKYLDSSGATPKDLQRINAIGETFEPKYVGSWIRVDPGRVATGWQFQHDFELTALGAHTGDAPVWAQLSAWFERAGLSRASLLGAPLDSHQTNLRIPLPGADAIDVVDRAFRELPTTACDLDIGKAMNDAGMTPAALVLVFAGAEVQLVGARFEDVRSDELSSLCKHAGVELDTGIGPLENALGATGVSALSLEHEGGKAARVLAHFEPGSRDGEPKQRGN